MPTSTLIIGRQRARIALAVAAFAALLWTGYEIYQQRELGAALKTPTAPRGIDRRGAVEATGIQRDRRRHAARALETVRTIDGRSPLTIPERTR